MMKKSPKSGKCMNLDYSDDYRAMLDRDNPYNYNFGSAKGRIHTDVFKKLQNRVNFDFFSKK